MTQEHFDEFLKRTLPDLDPVPPTPREEMWARIERQRSFTKQVRRTTIKRTWVGWGVGLAAALAVGVGLGRITTLGVERAETPVAQVTNPAPGNTSVNREAYNVTVANHMTSAEALLTTYRTQTAGTMDPDMKAWARDLLTNTRLLMDSPAADDPEVAELLGDLELIIAQIAQASAPSGVEREIIRDGMKKTAVLPRLRATVGT